MFRMLALTPRPLSLDCDEVAIEGEGAGGEGMTHTGDHNRCQ